MRTYVVFITENDLDVDMSVQAPNYYKTLNGMVRNYFGNTNAVESFVRSYGYAVIKPGNVTRESIESIIANLKGRMGGYVDNYTIPVVIDCKPEELETVLTELDRMEVELTKANPNWKMNRLRPSAARHLEPL